MTQELQKIIDTPTPSVVNPSLRKKRRKAWASEIRRLLKRLGVKNVSVRTPNYSMASSVAITLPPAEDHDRSSNGHDFATCPLCQQRNQAREAIERVILGAFPDLNDRSEYVSDSFDFCLSVS